MSEPTTQTAPPPAPADTSSAQEPPPSILETSTVVISLGVFTGPAERRGLDEGLANFGYSDSEFFWGFDLSVETRVHELFWVGGRADFRMRQWAQLGGASTDAFGPAILALGGLRVPLGRYFDFGALVGAGFGAAIVRIHATSDVAALPRLHGGLHLGVVLFSGLRANLGVAFDYAESLALNDFDHRVSFGITAFRFALEGRI